MLKSFNESMRILYAITDVIALPLIFLMLFGIIPNYLDQIGMGWIIPSIVGLAFLSTIFHSIDKALKGP
jgi:hypothetical protein